MSEHAAGSKVPDLTSLVTCQKGASTRWLTSNQRIPARALLTYAFTSRAPSAWLAEVNVCGHGCQVKPAYGRKGHLKPIWVLQEVGGNPSETNVPAGTRGAFL